MQPTTFAHADDGAHAKRIDQILADLATDATRGLTNAEAVRRRHAYGYNELPGEKPRSMGRRILRQFQSPLIYLLLFAAGFAVVLGKGGDAAVILIVVIINAAIGTVQESRADRSMAALRRLSALRVRVVREGAEFSDEARHLVPGDIVLLSAGDAIAADARIIEAARLTCAEAALSGESLPTAKSSDPVARDALLSERTGMVYSGTHVTTGRGRAVVVATGVVTEVGKIARLTAGATEVPTPLERRIAQYGRYLVIAALLLFVAVVLLGLLRGMLLIDIVMVAISQMVAMVPEGLPVAMTIALAVGMQRMAARGAVVRRLSAVETLGSTTIICSDKTGTLTRNEMTATMLWLADGRTVQASGAGYAPEGALAVDGDDACDDPSVVIALDAMALCNDAQLVPPDKKDPRWRVLGDPTEGALLTLARKGRRDVDALRRQWPRWGEIPFDATEKMMATGHTDANGHHRVYIKGAPENVFELCARMNRGGAALAFDAASRAAAAKAAENMAAQAMRVLAIAFVDGAKLDSPSGFKQLHGHATLLAVVGQYDPPRDEVKVAVAQCQAAGVRPVMVTGDHKATGLAVARALGIAHETDRAVDGRELETMPELELRAALPRIAVFARVHPAQKLRIVEAFQATGNVVAMTGDGVNDAPALARADVGVAMGITGTEVAKSAANIVITDDNFATIVRAVEEGRLVYRNLKKVILYLFATSMAEVAVLLMALLFGYPLPLAAVQILWINLVTEGAVTINLIMEPPEGDEMRGRPVSLSEPLLSRAQLRRVVLMTPTIALSTFLYFIWRLSSGAPIDIVQTETFTVLAACQWFNVLNCESETRSALSLRLLKNHWLLAGLSIGVALQLAVIYLAPLNRLFHTTPISGTNIVIIGVVASVVLWAEELRKVFARTAPSCTL